MRLIGGGRPLALPSRSEKRLAADVFSCAERVSPTRHLPPEQFFTRPSFLAAKGSNRRCVGLWDRCES